MADPMAEADDIYAQLGIQPVINATGHVTILGGSVLSPGVQAAMTAANRSFAAMEEVLTRTGAAIAEWLGAEDAYVTSGCYAALVQGAAGILAGSDPERIAALPDTAGLPNEFLIQAATRYRYDRSVTTPGGKLVEVGDSRGTTAEQLRAAIGPHTAGILFFAKGENTPNTLKLAQVVEIAHAAGVAVLVDAAGEVYPLERMYSIAASGADLICFGGKYLGSGNSTGILCGSRAAVAAARRNGFVSYETENNRSVGRGYKIDRQEVIGTTVAVREWVQMDHEQRLQSQAERIATLSDGLADLPHIRARNVWDEEGGPWMRLRLEWDAAVTGKSAADVSAALRNGSPVVWLRAEGDALPISVHTLRDDDLPVLLRRLREELG